MIQDEVLAQRIGLVPLNVDPSYFEFKSDPVTKAVSVNQENLRNESMSREVFRHKEFEGCVELKRVRDFFICKS